MARYEHLPIYKKAMDLAVHMEQIVRNFSRCHKYTLGSELRSMSAIGCDARRRLLADSASSPASAQ
jgi:hypothetical protein